MSGHRSAKVVPLRGGYITLPRHWRAISTIAPRGKFTPAEAFWWLHSEAAWGPLIKLIDGQEISLQAGEIACSNRYLRQGLGWHRTTVWRFLQALETEGWITLKLHATGCATGSAPGVSIITICDSWKNQDGIKLTATTPATGSEANKEQKKEQKEEFYNQGAPREATQPVYDLAVPVLGKQGLSEDKARGLVSELLRTYTVDEVTEAMHAMAKKAPRNPRAYLHGTCKGIREDRLIARPPKPERKAASVAEGTPEHEQLMERMGLR